ncbi:cation diffusion facilitator family transporter [Campylobacter hyointestinalis]|uniref:cation diffusion facilitator family transporter n=1 Tax=Campylobacter hyointestinalis TaxID=198 RepID=UPI001BD4DAFA|nr:cation diffusion facilitator family transporter [Campylobacter hyointestinalis]MBT0611733.1 cation diffusion facilitator family transporter [Campylobacter hyointestinalis subsp. hyointestinalis]MDY3000013.1 cation diffusion facilitator family transporter [Campylobacter hyointestinalis]
MILNDIQKQCSYEHNFHSSNDIAKKNTLYATIFTAVMMIAEIIGGIYFGSMALLADGWHMSSHALALGLAYFAYIMSSRYQSDDRFNFGTYKIEILASYTSAIFLLVVAFFMVYHSVQRFINPEAIAYKEAIFIAIIGLIVNFICAWLLRGDHHAHHHEHENDLNLKAAYIHVLTDALTSILAIIALSFGLMFGADFLDPLMGIIGAILVSVWAVGLLKQSGKILLDANMNEPVVDEVVDTLRLFRKDIIIKDLHLLKVAKDKYTCIISLSSDDPIDIDLVKKELSVHEELVHILIEIYPK